MDQSLKQEICTQAEIFGVRIDQSSIKKHHSQGYISQVFSAHSNVGNIIIHVVKLNQAQEHIGVHRKMKPLSDALIQFGGIPIPKVYASFRFESYTVSISDFLPGTIAGKRKDIEFDFVDDWHFLLAEVGHEIERIIFRIHSFQVEKFGWLGDDPKKGGEFENWIDFLQSEIQLWHEKINLGERQIKEEHSNLANRLVTYFNSIKSEIKYIGNPVLVHADTTNPSNILVDKGKITGILDWEYALGGDPAWEFTFKNAHSLQIYFALTRKENQQFDEDAFLYRIHLYYPLICGIWCFVHSFSPHTPLYSACRKHLDVTLQNRGY